VKTKKAGRASKASKDSAAAQERAGEIGKKDEKLNVVLTESEETNKIKTMPQSSDKKSGEASNGSQAAALIKASPASQKKVLLHEAVMNANAGALKPSEDCKASPSKTVGSLL